MTERVDRPSKPSTSLVYVICFSHPLYNSSRLQSHSIVFSNGTFVSLWFAPPNAEPNKLPSNLEPLSFYEYYLLYQ